MPRKKKGTVYVENLKSSCSSMSINTKEKPQQRNAANARERARMRVLSRAFCRLKTTLPWVPADTKLSKLDTLRLASSYIAHLKGILRDDPFAPKEPLHPAVNLTWPFGFNRGGGTGSGGGGSGSDEEDESGCSDCWDEVITVSKNPKDCIHLDISTKCNNTRSVVEDSSFSMTSTIIDSCNHSLRNSDLNSCCQSNNVNDFI